MEKTDKRYDAYLNILGEELVPTIGCTEPIAAAYAAARATAMLGSQPDRVLIEASENIIKNGKSVVVPNTGSLRGIAAAAAAGITAGDADKTLEVISCVDDAGRKKMAEFLNTREITVSKINTSLIFDLAVTVYNGDESAMVQISHFHTNIVLIKKNEEIIYRNQDCDEIKTKALTDRSILNIKDILDFSASVALQDVSVLLEQLIACNTKIAEQGLKGEWGANIGSVLLDSWGDDIKIRAKAMAAAGSDARMSGCELPVIIVSDSGNQGIANPQLNEIHVF